MQYTAFRIGISCGPSLNVTCKGENQPEQLAVSCSYEERLIDWCERTATKLKRQSNNSNICWCKWSLIYRSMRSFPVLLYLKSLSFDVVYSNRHRAKAGSNWNYINERVRSKHLLTLTHTYAVFRVSNSLYENSCGLREGRWRTWKRANQDTGRTCKLVRKRSQSRCNGINIMHLYTESTEHKTDKNTWAFQNKRTIIESDHCTHIVCVCIQFYFF